MYFTTLYCIRKLTHVDKCEDVIHELSIIWFCCNMWKKNFIWTYKSIVNEMNGLLFWTTMYQLNCAVFLIFWKKNEQKLLAKWILDSGFARINFWILNNQYKKMIEYTWITAIQSVKMFEMFTIFGFDICLNHHLLEIYNIN